MVVEENLSRDEIQATEVQFFFKHHSQFSVFVCRILSHGGEHDIYGVYQERILVKELMRVRASQTLKQT